MQEHFVRNGGCFFVIVFVGVVEAALFVCLNLCRRGCYVSVKYLVSFNESSILLYLEKLLKEESSWIRKLTSSVLKTGSASFWKPITAVFPKQNGADKSAHGVRHVKFGIKEEKQNENLLKFS